VALVTGVLAALAGGAAVAGQSDTDARGDVIGDPPGADANYDIASSSYGKLGSRKLEHTVTVVGRAGDPARRDGHAIPLLMIDVPKVPSNTNACDFFIGRRSTGAGPAVYRCGDEKRIGGAKVTRPSSGTIRYVFSRKAIKNPKRYGWAVAIRGRSGGSIVTYDRLPDYNSFDSYRVR
jgi:hypothetical protein